MNASFKIILSVALGLVSVPGGLLAEELLVPVVEGPWVSIAGNPDLGKYTSDKQQPVDFGVWQAADGTWQLWSCIRYTHCGGKTRVFHRWEGKDLTAPDWKPMGIAMEADASLGEEPGGMQAPHVVREGGKYHMFYGDWNNICHAVSDDGKTFERVIQPDGTTALFSEGAGANTRDIMMLKIGDLWHGYYTAFPGPNHQGTVYVRTTPDFKNWSESTAVSFGGLTGTGGGTAECPHVVKRNGKYYLFRTQHYADNPISTVYHSTNPKLFGINQDGRYLATRLKVAAMEIVKHNGQDYIVALKPTLDGIAVAKLTWKPQLKQGEPVFDFEDQASREEWKVESGKFLNRFTKTQRALFSPPQPHFIGTAEVDRGRINDSQTGVIRSPVFTIEDPQYFAYVSGGSDKEKLYVTIVDAENGNEIARLFSLSRENVFSPQMVDTENAIGRRAFIRVVDQSGDPWGHINFGGLFRAKR